MSGSRSTQGQQYRLPGTVVRNDGRAASPISRDVELIERVLAGERHLFHDLVRAYQKTVYILALRILRNEEEAEDAAQDSLLKAFKNLHCFRAESKFSTWLISIVLNEARVRLRRDRLVRFESIDDIRDGEDRSWMPPVIADKRENPLQRLEREELRRMLQDAIANLPRMYGQVLLLRDVEELSIREAAAELGVTEGVVRTRLFRARLMMQKILTAHRGQRLSAPSRREQKVSVPQLPRGRVCESQEEQAGKCCREQAAAMS